MGSVEAYKKAPVWKEFNIVGINGIEDYEQEMEEGKHLLIYPNPATGTCSIVIPKEFQNESVLTLSVYDVTGVLVQQIELNNETENFSLKIDQKAQGVYVAVLSNGKKEYKGKVVFN
jgi:hypothetical protein